MLAQMMNTSYESLQKYLGDKMSELKADVKEGFDDVDKCLHHKDISREISILVLDKKIVS
jgi:hypothetical protein